MNTKKECDLFIIKWLYKLSLKYDYIGYFISVDGFTDNSERVGIYGGIYNMNDGLSKEIESFELMMSDKPKYFRYISEITPILYINKNGRCRELNYYFDLYKKELREYKLNNLLDD